MIKKILPIILVLICTGVSMGAGIFLRPADEHVVEDAEHPAVVADEAGEETHEYVKMNNQFVIPVVGDGQVRSLVVVSLSLEIALGGSEEFYQREPKLRDAFLQELFNHANLGGFDGVFTDSVRLSSLRMALEEVASKIMTVEVMDVLVTDIVRQDI